MKRIQFQPGNGRVVLDLKYPGVVKKSFSIPNSETNDTRIVIDIKRTLRSKFIKFTELALIEISQIFQ